MNVYLKRALTVGWLLIAGPVLTIVWRVLYQVIDALSGCTKCQADDFAPSRLLALLLCLLCFVVVTETLIDIEIKK